MKLIIFYLIKKTLLLVMKLIIFLFDKKNTYRGFNELIGIGGTDG